MGLTKETANAVENTIKSSIRNKFQKYKPETKEMPFHYRLLGKDRMALYSFIQSLKKTFVVSIFEPVAETVAKQNFVKAKRQHIVGDKISEAAQQEVQNIMDDLSIGSSSPNKPLELEKIRKVASKGKLKNVKVVKADLFLEDNTGSIYLFDLKTAKPNISSFKDFKRTLLEWSAIAMHENPDANINTLIAIPYNPYEPKPYQRWTLKGMLDLENELKVASEFWNFLGGKGAYEDLLNCFERVGIEMRDEIDEYFRKFK